MITIVLTYRNRTLNIVKKCLDSLQNQSNKQFTVTIINYGSEVDKTIALEKLLSTYTFIDYSYCATSYQLWNKAKAINIALKQCKTSHLFVGDIDMMFRADFIEKLETLKNSNEITYFNVGFLNKEESSKNQEFNKYKVKHISQEEATGMTLYPTELLKQINGYDEFYHGWGSEDTDVHIRLQNAGYKINFYEQEVMLLHQWHPRIYRSKKSMKPFHTSLEQINQQYLQQAVNGKRIKANENFNWGKNSEKVVFTDSNSSSVTVTNLKSDLDAFFIGTIHNYSQNNLVITIKKYEAYTSVKNNLKRIVGKKYFKLYHFQEINNIILTSIITNFRSNYYEYKWDQELQTISLKIAL